MWAGQVKTHAQRWTGSEHLPTLAKGSQNLPLESIKMFKGQAARLACGRHTFFGVTIEQRNGSPNV